MHPLVRAVAIAVAAAVPSVAVSAPPPPAPTPPVASASAAASAEAEGLDRTVCRRVTPTGSRLKGGRVCKTQREWLTEKENARRFGDDVQKRIKIPDKAAGG